MLEKAANIAGQLIEWRRDFHRHPELGFQEHRTAARVAEIMTGLGWRVQTGVGRTGVVAELGTGKPVIALRGDMDALPIHEFADRPYASTIPDVMHACGHDAHTAILLGVGSLLREETFPGTVRLLFQPSEEVTDDEGLSGAQRMIQDGAMKDVEMVLALHVDAYQPVGAIRVIDGPASGGVDTFYSQIYGKGGHGARPHDTIDPFYLTAQVVLALNVIVSRRLDPFDPAVVSIGRLHGGEAPNVIPHCVEIDGTIRFLNKEVRQQIHAEIRRAFEITRTMGGDYTLEIETGSMPMLNHPAAVAVITAAAQSLIGADHILPWVHSLGAEDFGCLTEIAPGAMFNLGARIEGDERHHHHSRFDIDERCLPIGTAILAEAALRFLNQ